MIEAQMITAFAQARLKPRVVYYWAMNALGPTWQGFIMSWPLSRRRARAGARIALLLIAVAFLSPRDAAAAPFIWDQDQDKLDDRIETVHAGGYALAFEQGDTLL